MRSVIIMIVTLLMFSVYLHLHKMGYMEHAEAYFLIAILLEVAITKD